MSLSLFGDYLTTFRGKKYEVVSAVLPQCGGELHPLLDDSLGGGQVVTVLVQTHEIFEAKKKWS